MSGVKGRKGREAPGFGGEFRGSSPTSEAWVTSIQLCIFLPQSNFPVIAFEFLSLGGLYQEDMFFRGISSVSLGPRGSSPTCALNIWPLEPGVGNPGEDEWEVRVAQQTVREVLCNPLGNWGMGCIHPGSRFAPLQRSPNTWGDLEKVELGLWCPDALSLWVQGRAGGGDASEVSARSSFPLGLCKRLYLSPNNSGSLEVT